MVKKNHAPTIWSTADFGLWKRVFQHSVTPRWYIRQHLQHIHHQSLILHQIQGLTDKLEWRPSNNSSTTLIKSTYPWSLDFLPDVISTTSFVSVRWCKGNHFLLWNRRILKTCLSTLPMTLARYNNAKECFVMKLKQNSANCSIDIIWAMWVTMNDNTTGYTLWRRVWAQF